MGFKVQLNAHYEQARLVSKAAPIVAFEPWKVTSVQVTMLTEVTLSGIESLTRICGYVNAVNTFCSFLESASHANAVRSYSCSCFFILLRTGETGSRPTNYEHEHTEGATQDRTCVSRGCEKDEPWGTGTGGRGGWSGWWRGKGRACGGQSCAAASGSNSRRAVEVCSGGRVEGDCGTAVHALKPVSSSRSRVDHLAFRGAGRPMRSICPRPAWRLSRAACLTCLRKSCRSWHRASISRPGSPS